MLKNKNIQLTRIRRNKHHSWIREIVAEVNLTVNDLILPVFIIEGHNLTESIESMPGVFKLSIDNLIKHAKQAKNLGIKAIALFPSLSKECKSENAKEAYNPDNLICRAVKSLKDSGLNIGIIVDIALDPYTLSGHDGILKDNYVDNDLTVEILVKQASTLAQAGADVLAPSDMMDGKVFAIRSMLESQKFCNVNIFSYSAKYCSNLYSPFRSALNIQNRNSISKDSYQLDKRNAQDAVSKIKLDFEEGADMIIVKPSLMYLDIIKEASSKISKNILAFQVSGEYSMLKHFALVNQINWEKMILESLICIKRSGAKAIFSYAALEVAQYLQNSK
ncbi:MAG: porphobilinogen synthase [Rickettsia sp.]|nr:porphobilinogen synthase [Rickettsia sp.]